MELLRSLKKEQILEVLSDGVCRHCESRLQARITSLRRRKIYETSYHDDDDDGFVASKDAYHISRNQNDSVSYRRRHEKEDSPMNYFHRHEKECSPMNHFQWHEKENRPRNHLQGHEFTCSRKRHRHATDSSPRYLPSRRQYLMQSNSELLNDEISGDLENVLLDEQEFVRYSEVARRKDSSHIRRLEKHEDSPQSFSYRQKSVLLMKPNQHATDSSPRFMNSRRQSLMQSDFEGIDGDLLFESGFSEKQKQRIRYSPDGRKKDFRLAKQGDSPWNFFQRHESTLSTKHDRHDSDFKLLLNDGLGGDASFESKLSEEQKECVRCSLVGRKKDFVYIERINGVDINVLEGLELHTQVFNVEEQRNIVKYVYKLQRMGRNGQLRERTYSEPRKWMRGKGRVTIQFGCCYNYAVDKYGNAPGIVRDEEVDPLPHLFKQMIKRMVKWHILPLTCIPNSCIVNIYDEGDCIPPHIDHHDFLRPFSSVSLLSECDIVIGSNLKVMSPGDFQGPVAITLPVGSVFVLNGNGADVAKHCVPSVPTKRISITFRKMDDSKLPFKFSPDSALVGIEPLPYSPPNKTEIGHDNVKNSESQQH